MIERAPCKCHGSWPAHADAQALELRTLRAEHDRATRALAIVLADCRTPERCTKPGHRAAYRALMVPRP